MKTCEVFFGFRQSDSQSIIFMTMRPALNLPPAKITQANTPDDLYVAHQLLLEYQEDKIGRAHV